jgi:uncharacterized membrane protein
MLDILALLIGVIAGLRALLAPAAIAWAARLGWLDLHAPFLAFLGYRWTPWLLSLLALGELAGDKLPTTPSRKTPPAFAARIASGALCGGAIGASAGQGLVGALLGAIGAVVGTLGGAAIRANLARAFVNDRPAALIEDAVAIAAATLILFAL